MIKKVLTFTAITCSAVSFCAAQSFQAFIETDQVFSASGDPVNFGDTINGNELNVFYGTVSASTDLAAAFSETTNLESMKSAFGSISWSPMVEFTNPGAEWFSGSDGISIGVNERPVIALMNASGPAALENGSEIGLLSSVEITTIYDNITTGFTDGFQPYTVIVGDSGSITLTAVPEPSHYAAALGLLGLGLVIWRRRRQ